MGLKLWNVSLRFDRRRVLRPAGRCQPISFSQYGRLVQKYLKASGCSSESRFKAARLSEWLTIGGGVPGCMHEGGSSDGVKLVVKATTPMEEYVDYARNIMKIDEEVRDPENQKKK